MSVESNRNDFRQQFKKRCFKFSLLILQLSSKMRTGRDNAILLDQLVRSGTSIGANIVEGGNSSSKREFINFFQISLKSASETLYWLSLLKETNEKSSVKIDLAIKECMEIKKILSTIILNTKSNSRF